MRALNGKIGTATRNGAIGLLGVWLAATNTISFTDTAVIGVRTLPQEGFISAEQFDESSTLKKYTFLPIAGMVGGMLHTIITDTEYNILDRGRQRYADRCGQKLLTQIIDNAVESHAGRNASIAFNVNQAIVGIPGRAAGALLTGIVVSAAETLSSGRAGNTQTCLTLQQ